jgi:hypothetical protein
VGYPGNAARLQIVAGQYPQALASIEELRRLSPLGGRPQQRAMMAQYEIYATSKQLQARERVDFDTAFRRSFEARSGVRVDFRSPVPRPRAIANELLKPKPLRGTIARFSLATTYLWTARHHAVKVRSRLEADSSAR